MLSRVDEDFMSDIEAMSGSGESAVSPEGAGKKSSLIDAIHQAEQKGEFFTVASHALKLRVKFPNAPEGYRHGAIALKSLGLFEEAATVVAKARGLFQNESWPLEDAFAVSLSRGRFEETDAICAELRDRFPLCVTGYSTMPLRQLGRLGEARAAADIAIERFPDEAWPLVEKGKVELLDGHFEMAADIAAQLLDRFPANPDVHSLGIVSLRCLGRLDEAAARAEPALALFPEQRWTWQEALNLAIARNDTIEHASLSNRARPLFPDWPELYATLPYRLLGRFDEGMDVARLAMARFPDAAWPLVEAGNVARTRGDNLTALDYAEQVKTKFPDDAGGHALSIVAQRCLGAYGEAFAAAGDAMARFPNQQWPYQEHGFILRHLQRDEEAITAARLARDRFPSEPWPWRDEASVYKTQGLFPEAEKVLAEALALFPGNRGILEDLAEVAHRRLLPEEADRYLETLMQMFPQDAALALKYATRPAFFDAERLNGGETLALTRLDALHNRFPDFDEAFVAHTDVLLRSGRFDEAETLLSGCRERMSRHQVLCLYWADVATTRRDFEAAANRLTQFKQWFPMVPDGYIRLAKVMAQQLRIEEAEAVCAQAMERFPASPDIYEARAWTAQLYGDDKTAVLRWRDGQHAFPDDLRFQKGAYEAELRLMERSGDVSGPDDGSGPDKDDVAGSLQSLSEFEAPPPEQMMMLFQNLGAPSNGCEFGSVQRHYGAEPLGLLRWISAKPAALARLLNDDFEGLWDEEQTEVVPGQAVVTRAGDREYTLFFHRYDMHMHTWIYMSEMKQEEFVTKFRRRLRLLSRKIDEDLKSGATIFVYKEDLDQLSNNDVGVIIDALRRFNKDNVLLFVKNGTPEHPDGSVEMVSPNLINGYIDGFMVSPEGYSRQPRFETWSKICAETYRLWKDARVRLAEAS